MLAVLRVLGGELLLDLRRRRLVAGDTVADVDALHEAEVGELVDGAIDARDSDPAAGGTDPVEDLLGGQAAALLAEMLDDRCAGAALAKPRRTQAVEGLLRPCRVRLLHVEMIAALKDVLASPNVIARIVLIIPAVVVILGVSANTVNKYIVSSIQKFGAGNRAMAIAVAIRAGVI